MQTIDLREDAKVFRRELESNVKSIVAAKPASLSALEIGYSCDQSGWIFIHADERPQHERDGQWTTKIDEDRCVDFGHCFLNTSMMNSITSQRCDFPRRALRSSIRPRSFNWRNSRRCR